MRNKILRKGLVVGIIVFFIGICIIPSSGIQLDNTIVHLTYRGNNLYVGGSGPNNYTKIQDAIDDANNGDKVYVYNYSSPYIENILIEKSINLIGEDKFTTIIDGNKMGTVIALRANNVNISGFTLKNSGHWWMSGGINYIGKNITIYNNILSNNMHGIWSHSYSSDINIYKNIITNNEKGGIDLYLTKQANVGYNIFKDNSGIALNLNYEGNHNIILNAFINNQIALSSFVCYNCLVSKNNFIRNRLILSAFLDSKVSWDKNYWGKPMIFPKVLIGWEPFWIIPPDEYGHGGIPGIYPYPMFDWHPAKNPYEIPDVSIVQGCGIE